MMKSDLSQRLDEFLDFFPIMDKEVAINVYGIKFLADTATFDEWEFPTFVIEDASRRTAPRMNLSERRQRSVTMGFKANGFEMPMDFVTDPQKLLVFIQEMQRLNDNIKQTWAYRILETVILESLTSFFEEYDKIIPLEHEAFMDEYQRRADMLLAIQKSGTQFLGIETKIVPKMRNRLADPDRVLNPAGSLRHIEVVNEVQRVVSEVGSDALIQNKVLDVDIPQPATGRTVTVARTKKYGLRHHETRLFDLGDNMEARDPCVYPLTISNRWRMEPNERMDLKDYTSDSRTIEVCDGELGKFDTITLKQAFCHCGIFHTKGNAEPGNPSELTDEGRKILTALCSTKRAPHLHGSQHTSAVPDHLDPEYDTNATGLVPPFFGLSNARTDMAQEQDDKLWDGLERSINAYTLFKRAGHGLLNDVVKLLRCLPEDKYEDFLRVIRHQESLSTGPVTTMTSLPSKTSRFTYVSAASGTKRFSSIFDGSGTTAPTPSLSLGSMATPFSQPKPVGQTGAAAIQTRPAGEYTYFGRQFQTLLVPVNDLTAKPQKLYRMLDPETGLPSTDGTNAYDKFANMLEAVRVEFEYQSGFDSIGLQRLVGEINKHNSPTFNEIFDPRFKDVDFHTKVILNIINHIAQQLARKGPALNLASAAAKRTELHQWYELVDGKTDTTNVGRLRSKILSLRTAGSHVKTLLDSVDTIHKEVDVKAPGVLSQEAKDAADRLLQLDTVLAQQNTIQAQAAGNAKPIVYAFLGGDVTKPETLGANFGNDAKAWAVAEAIVIESTRQSDVVHGLNKLLVQHYIVLLLTNSGTPEVQKKVGQIASLKTANEQITEIIRSAPDELLSEDQYNAMVRVSKRNRQAASSKKRRITQSGQGSSSRKKAYVSDSDSDDDDEPAPRRGGRHKKSKKSIEDCEPIRDVADVLFMLYRTRLTKDFFLLLITHNIPFPMSFDCLQQWIRLTAGSTVFLRTGITTGLMAINEAAMMFSRNPETFTVRVYARFSCGTIISNRRNLEFVPHTYCMGYRGGAGLILFDYDKHKHSFRMGNYPFHVLPIANPYAFKSPTIHFDITGEQSRDLYAGPQENWYYPTSLAYCDMLQLGRSQQAYPHVFHRNYFVEDNARNS